MKTAHSVGGKGSKGPPQPPPPPDPDDDEVDDEYQGPTLKKQFAMFAKVKNSNDPATHILLSQSDAWMKHAGVIRGRILTTTDTGVCYFKFKKHKLDFDEYVEFLTLLADYKKIPVNEILEKMTNCGTPPQEANVSVGRPVPR